jgi:hypothetical protein
LTAAVTLVLAMMVLPVFASSVSTLFAGADSFDQAIQAQQYALIEADILHVTAYDNLADKTKAAISNSEGFQREVLLGAEETIDGKRQRIATVNIYKEGESQKRYALKVPLLGGAAAGELSKVTVFTESGIFTVPVSGIYKITCIGGGGGGSYKGQGGRGGGQGASTSFGSLLSAIGGSGGGGAAANSGGGGGQAGIVAYNYFDLTAGQQVICTIGAGGAGGVHPSGSVSGTDGIGPTPGRGSPGQEGAGGGAPGASNGSLGTDSDGVGWDSAGCGGAGAVNALGYGHGGGGGGGGRFDGYGGAAGLGAQYGKRDSDGGNGGAGGSGAIIIEW